MRTLLADRTRGLWSLLLLGTLAVFAATPAGAANIIINNANAPGVGFNDATPRAPVGGNPGTTLGAQRLFIFQTAANIWSGVLPSNVTIVVNAQFAALTCTATSAVLGSAGATTIHRDFAGAPFAGTWYNQALANKLFGSDLAANPDINATFNLNIDAGCFGPGLVWYYGTDGLEGTNIELLPVVLHEIGHGLGFQTFTAGNTGAYNGGFPSIADRFLYDTVNGLHWNQNTAAQRAASTISLDKLAWDGPAVTKEAVDFLGPRPVLQINSPAGIAGVYAVQTATFGSAITLAGLTGNVVLADDGAAPTADGCSPLVNAGAIAGNIALIDRGVCTFTAKALAAQAAGAVGLIVANNAAGLPGMGGTDPSITIPCVGISQADGNSIKANLAGGVNVTIHLDPSLKAGSDNAGRVLMYAPNPFASGSSVSHFDISLTPNALMEPAINNDLHTNLDLTPYMFRDIGWFSSTTLDLVASSTSLNCGDKLTLTGTVSPLGGAKGTIQFFDGAASLGSAPVINNTTGTLSISSLAVGNHSITSSYTCFTCSTATVSNKVSVDVGLVPTTTSLTSSPNPSSCGDKVTLTATVSAAAATGFVTFLNNLLPLGSAPVVNGVATLSYTFNGTAVNSLTADYGGDACYAASSSDKVAQVVTPTLSTISLVSDLNPSACGQKVNFTATVSPVPQGGTMEFFDGATPLGSAPIVNGSATLSVTDLTAGSHSITALWGGDNCYAGSISNKIDQVVNPIATSTTLESEPNPSGCGLEATFVATVSPAPGSGTVNFFDGATPIGSAAVLGATATLTIATLSVGTHSITAVFKGTDCYLASTSDKLFHEVVLNVLAVALSADANPATCGAKVTLKARLIEPLPPGLAFNSGGHRIEVAPPPTGTVNFFDNGNPIGSAPVVDSVATLSVTDLTVGSHSIIATYKGDDCYAISTSDKLNLTVDPNPTTTTLTSSPNPSNCGDKVTVIAKVDPTPAGGTVTVYDNGNLLGTAPVVNGLATFSVTTLTAGSHSLVGEYSGDGCFGSSLAEKIVQEVNATPTATTLTTDPNPSTCGAKVTVTAKVDPPSASGEVNFFDGTTQIGAGTLVNGVATLSITPLAVGPHSLTAVYKGDACNSASTSNKVEQVVVPSVTQTTLVSSPNPSTCQQKVTLTASVVPASATGEVNFLDGGLPVGSGTLVNGVATLSLTVLSEGTHVFTAVYKGDGCNAPSTSNEVTHSHGCPTATLLSLFRAEPVSGTVELRWQFGDPAGFSRSWIERGVSAQGPWTAIDAQTRVEAGVTVAVDRAVEPGKSYWYRLVAQPEAGASLVFGPLSATAGGGIQRFELASIWPNPSKGNFRIDFAVAREANIRLSIVDIQGREVALLAEGTHRPGRYQAVWTGETAHGPAAVGMYFVRYQVPNKVLTGRLVLSR